MSHPLLSTADLRIGYPGNSLLPPITFAIRPGEFWAVVGRNGSGKTTLFRTLLGLHPALTGTIERDAAMVPAYVPQRAALDPLVPLRVYDVLSLGMERGWSFARFGGGTLRKPLIMRCLAHVGMEAYARAQFHELSEGQKQKVLLARVLAGNANIAFLDEPTAAMDSVAEQEALAAIDHLRKVHGIAIVIVSHFMHVARDVADNVLFLDPDLQSVVTGTPAEVLSSSDFRRRYGDLE
jgi:zinc transport system ATP-binding protein